MTVDPLLLDQLPADRLPHDRPCRRRALLAGMARGAGGLVLASALPPLFGAGPARAALVAPDDQRLAVERVTLPGASGDLPTYLARPAAAAGQRLPAVIVVHENRGLDLHIEDVVRRTALAGFLALAPDLLAPKGGTPEDAKQARELVSDLQGDPVVADLVAAMIATRLRPDCSGTVGAIGFGWGGGMVCRLATVAQTLDAGVSFYGKVPNKDEAARIRTPLLLHYAALDEKVNEGVPGFEAALKAARVEYTLESYPGVDQSFNNDTARGRFNAQASTLAWDRTVAFLKRELG